MKIGGAICVVAAAVLSAGTAQAIDWTNTDGDNDWMNGNNWDGGSVPAGNDKAAIDMTGSDKAILDSDTWAEIDYLRVGTTGAGELEIRGDLTVANTGSPGFGSMIGGGTGKGEVNQFGGAVSFEADNLHLGFSSGSGSEGTWNLMGGALEAQDIYVGDRDERGGVASGIGTLNISGGSLVSGKSLNIMPDSTFSVAGSGSDGIDVASSWIQESGSTLKVGIDSGGVTPITMNGSGTIKFDGALLDVGFLDGHEEKSTWTVMDWSSGSYDMHERNDLSFAEDVDGTKWMFNIDEGEERLDVTYIAEPSGLIAIAGRQCELAVTEATPRTVRITLTPLGESLEPDDVLASREWPRPALRIAELGEEHTIRLENLRVTIRPSPLTIEIDTPEGEPVQKLRVDRSTGDVEFSLGQGRLFGLGSGSHQFDRRGEFYPMECQGANHLGDEGWIHGHRLPIPFLLSTDNWGLFIHLPYSPSFDLRGESGACSAQSGGKGLPLDLFVTRGDEPAALTDEYTRLTGRPAMPPRWALGFLQSHRTLAGPEEVLSVANTFRRKKLPCDGLIYLGTGFCPAGWNLGHGSFEFNSDTFPEPEKMIKQLHDRNFKIVLHTTRPPENLHGEIPPRPDEEKDSDHIATFWEEKIRPIMETGVDGWWPDTGQRLPVKAKMARIRMFYHGQLEERPGVRPFTVYENVGYSGMQRYGAWSRTGDTGSTWETLQAQVPNVVNASLSGVPYIGSCPGGFNPTRELTGEMYARWFQFCAFTPYFQAHGRTWHTRLPWGWNTGELGPKEGKGREPDESNLNNPAIEPICREYLELRYQLAPYLYTLSREAYDTGMPILRAMWLHYADDPVASRLGSQYLWGRNILVAPVTAKGAEQRELYLPEGVWYDFWTNDRIRGGKEITRPVDLETMPLYVRAGAIIPFDPVRQYTGQPVDDPTTIRIYAGDDGEFVLYDDDGESLGYMRNKEATWTRFIWDDASKRLTIEPDQRSTAEPDSRLYRLLLLPGGAEKTVEYQGEAFTECFGK